ncbi:MAG: hypothetical protein AAGA81_19540 [Acidobacteriota bacterium]
MEQRIDGERLSDIALATVSRFPLAKPVAEQILRATLTDFLAKAPRLSQPSVWLAATLRRRCIEALREAPATRPERKPARSLHKLTSEVA